MKDNYGNEVPSDLVLLPGYESCDDQEIRIIAESDWYEVIDGNGNVWLCCSTEAIGDICDDFVDIYAEGGIVEIMAVNDGLKRWSLLHWLWRCSQ